MLRLVVQKVSLAARCSRSSSSWRSYASFSSEGSFLRNDARSQSILASDASSRPKGISGAAPVMTSRDERVERLSAEVFSRGNTHLKNVNSMAALPEGFYSFPEVCFIGKPNSGKSTIISALLHNERMGRSGMVRGTTRILQFFNVGDGLLLVDTPGYGGWRGRKVDEFLAERATAFAALFRYLALRKSGNLKMVYWVMAVDKKGMLSFQPRDEEILTFLQRERIRFTVVVSKIDRHAGREELIRANMQQVWEFVGSTAVPIIGVAAHRKRPDLCTSIDVLQHDIVHHCSSELSDDDLSFKGLHALSYSPPTVSEITAAESAYPIESFIIPEDDNMSMATLIEQHETAKRGFLANSANGQLYLSSKDMVEKHLRPCTIGDESASQPQPQLPASPHQNRRLSVDTTVNIKANESQLVNTSDGEDPSSAVRISAGYNHSHRPVNPQSTSDRVPHSHSPSQRTHQPHRRIVRLGSTDDLDFLYDTPMRANSNRTNGSEEYNGNSDDSEISQQQEHPSPPRNALRTIHSSPSSVIHTDSSPRSVGIFSDPSIPLPTRADPFEPCAALDRTQDTVPFITGIHVPKSMITKSIENAGLKAYESQEKFASESAYGSYEELLQSQDEFFCEEGPHDRIDDDTGSRVHRVSHRKRSHDRLMEKYIGGKRLKRSIYLHAEGFMCPWLAGAGQHHRHTVHGLSQSPSSGHSGGRLMKGLKTNGFGGKSNSAMTYKNKGRATKKTGHWAA